MNNDEHPSNDYPADSSNALAGPSTLVPSTISSDLPPLFLPPSAPPAPPVYLTSTQDLLARFHLLTAYNKYVTPHVTPSPDSGVEFVPGDKGKGKERASPAAQTPGGDGADADDEEGGTHGEKKKKNSYKHLIKGVPGKHSMKKDDYLMTMMQVPPKQRMPITQFDIKTQREAFTVSLDGLKGWNPNALVLESAQAREDRKKRKELKKLAKQGLLPVASTSILVPPSTPSALSHPPAAATAAVNPLTPSSTTATPNIKPSIPRPASRPTVPPVQVPPTGRVGTPGGNTPVTGTPTTVTARPAVGGANGMAVGDKRGKKRDFEEARGAVGGQSGSTGGAVTVNGNANVPGSGGGTASKAVVSAKAGIAGVRPRPVKKQRMVCDFYLFWIFACGCV